MKRLLKLCRFIIAILFAILTLNSARANNITEAAVSTLGTSFLINAATIGGGDTGGQTSASFDRSFGTPSVGPNGTTITITGIAWASLGSGVTASSVTVTITYLGADGVSGGADDIVIGTATDSVTANTTAGTWCWAFTTPMTKVIDGANNLFRVNITRNGTGSINYKTTGSGTQPLSAAKLSVAGTTVAYTVPTPPTWTGASGTSWATIGNWSPGVLPATADTVLFNSSSTANLATVLNQNFSLAGVTLSTPSGPVSIGGANTLTLGAGGLNLSAANQNLTVTAPMILGAAQTWSVASGQTLSVGGSITGGVDLTVAGAGKISLGAANILPNGAGAGNLIVNGTLDLNGYAATINGLNGSGILDSSAGGGAGVLTIGNNDATSTFSGTIQNTSGTLTLVKSGAGAFTLTGTNTFGGGFTNNGTGAINSGNATGTNNCFGTGLVVMNAGSIYITPVSYTFTNALTLNGATLRVGGGNNHLITWSGLVNVAADSFLSCDGGTAGITLSGGLTNAGFTIISTGGGTANTISSVITGSGTIMPNFAGNTLNLNAANTFTGTNRAALGTLKIGNANALQNATLDMNAADTGTVNLNNLNATIGALTGSHDLSLGSGIISIGNNNASTTYSGALTNTGALKKIGGGALTLSGTNIYSGNTTISAGTLGLSGAGAIAATPMITIVTNAIFDVAAVGSSPYVNPSTRTLAFGIDKTGGVKRQGQMVIGGVNLTYGGSLTVTKTGADALANGDSFTLVPTTGGTFNGWFANVTLPALASGISWDTNKLAATGVLDIYSFTTTPLALTTPTNTAVVITVSKLANHVGSARGVSVAVAASTPVSGGTASVDGGGNLTYMPGGAANVNGGTDTFTVTFADGHGAQTMTVNVTVGANNSQSLNVLSAAANSGNFQVQFAGIPGYSYTVETNAAASGAGWAKEQNITIPAGGVFQITDPLNNQSLFYRTVYPSY